MDWRVIPPPEQLLAWVDRLIALRHKQMGDLRKLRRLLMSQVFLFEAIAEREADAPRVVGQRSRRRRT